MAANWTKRAIDNEYPRTGRKKTGPSPGAGIGDYLF